MVKVEVEANELRNGNIEKISLVTNGAIRQPFKILKTEEIEQHEGFMTGVRKFFGTGNDEDAQVAALFVRKTAVPTWLPLIKNNGFRAEKEHAELDGDVLILKQESFDADKEGSMIALTPDVGIMLDRVVKGFDPYPMSASFDENVRASAFFPGLHNALESLAETVWNVLYEAESPETAASDVAKQIKAFGAHVNNLVSELPQTVFKMEAESLNKEFECSTVSDSSNPDDTIAKDEDNMTTPVLKEAAPGDLDGLLDDAPAADAALAKAEAEAEAAVEKTDEVTYLDLDGNEISKEDFEKACGMKKGGKMKKGKMKKGEAEVSFMQLMADDAEGEDIFDIEKSGDAGAPKSGGSPGSGVVDSTSDTGAVSLDEGGVPAGMRKEERTMKSVEDGKVVEKTGLFYINDETKEEIFAGFVTKEEEAPAADATSATDGQDYSAAELKLFEAMGVLVKGVQSLKETVEKQSERMDAIEKTASDAKETAEETVVLNNLVDDLDESLATLQGHTFVKRDNADETVEKTEEDIFKGLLPQIEAAV